MSRQAINVRPVVTNGMLDKNPSNSGVDSYDEALEKCEANFAELYSGPSRPLYTNPDNVTYSGGVTVADIRTFTTAATDWVTDAHAEFGFAGNISVLSTG